MAAQHILYLRPSGLVAFAVARSGIETQQRFSLDEGLQRFDSYLSGLAAGTRISLLVDLPDEAHHLETLPFIRGRDRRLMLARRQDHLFGDTPFRSHQSLGRERDGRRDERILFAALTRPTTIQPWLQRIVQSPCILAEVVSTSFLSQALATALRSDDTPFLLAHTTPAGLRVSCFEHGKLRFSRLTVSPAAHLRPDAGFVRDEIRRSFDYLLSQRILPRERPTEVLVLTADDETCTALDTGRTLSPGLDLQPMSLRRAALALKLEHAPTSIDSLPLLLQALATHPRLPQFAPAAALAGHRLQQIERVAAVIAAGFFLACLGYSSLNLLAARNQRSLAEASQRQVTLQEARLKAVIAGTPATPIPLERLQQALDLVEALAASSKGPEPALRQLAAALTPAPGFSLQEIEWSVPRPDRQPFRPEPATQTLRVRFSLPPGTEQTRERVEQAKALLAALGTLPGAQLQVMRQPPEMTESEPLQIAGLPPGDTPPQLEVRIHLPLAATP